MRLISQSIKGILTVLQKLLQYFNSIAISTIFALPLTGFFLDIFTLDWNEFEIFIATSSSTG